MLVDRHNDMNVFVGVDTDDDLSSCGVVWTGHGSPSQGQRQLVGWADRSSDRADLSGTGRPLFVLPPASRTHVG